MRRLAVAIAVLALGGFVGSTAFGVTLNPFKTPDAMESFLLHGVTGGVFLQKGTTHYGPIVAAACRGDGPSKMTVRGRGVPSRDLRRPGAERRAAARAALPHRRQLRDTRLPLSRPAEG